MKNKTSLSLKGTAKLPLRIKINIGIFGVLAIMFVTLPNILFRNWFPASDDSQPQYEGGFSYILHDICPCHASDDSCMGYYACGPDKANITYNLDNAPEDRLEVAKRDQYFENMIETNRHGFNITRLYLLCDASYMLSFLSLVAGVIYWNHNMAKR